MSADDAAEKDADQEPTFDEGLATLEKIVKDLESGDVGLDDALLRFEDGVALTKRLRKRLDAAEGKIQQLLEDGGVEDVDA